VSVNLKASSSAAQQAGTAAVRLRCPLCRQRGSFEHLGINDLLIHGENAVVGLRRCPDPNCYGVVFFVLKQGLLVDSYPAETIDFDATNIPVPVQNALEEAIKCHAQRCL
jgi:hypothetical protein